MRKPGGRHLRPDTAVRPSPILFTIVFGTGLVWASLSVRADSVIDRWRLFTPASAQKMDTTPNPAVVRVIVDEGTMLANGSGSFVAARDQYGLVVTNWHVIRDAKGPIHVVFPDGFRSEATLLKTDQDWDLAALLIWRPNVAPISICSTAPQPGDPLTIAGYGQGDYRAVTGKCTQYLAPSMKHPYEILELSVVARKGDSGGPILTDKGELAGVLFGADRGTTSGSYCGRVRWFLSAIWPELKVSNDLPTNDKPLVTFSDPTSNGLPVNEPSRNIATANPPLIPISPEPQPVNAASGNSGSDFPDLEPAADSAVSMPYTSLPPFPAPTTKSAWSWNELIGSTRIDQAKSFLALLGILALWGHLSRWISN